MIIPTNGPNQALGAHLQKIHKTNLTPEVERASRRDVVSISKFSALVEQARSCAMSLPEIRSDVVERARQALMDGNIPGGNDIASAMINRAAKGQV